MSTNKQHKTIWTIGHSTHTLAAFLAMLESFKIEIVADIKLSWVAQVSTIQQRSLRDFVATKQFQICTFKEIGREAEAKSTFKKLGLEASSLP